MDLWIKREGQHKLTSKGTLWEHCPGDGEVETEEVYVISTTNRTEYIVAVVQIGNEEKPVVLSEANHKFSFTPANFFFLQISGTSSYQPPITVATLNPTVKI